jgi:hypothetical protein
MGKADEDMEAGRQRRFAEMGWTPPATPQLADAVTMGFPIGVVRALAKYLDTDLWRTGPMPGEVLVAAGDALEWLKEHHLYSIEVLGAMSR